MNSHTPIQCKSHHSLIQAYSISKTISPPQGKHPIITHSNEIAPVRNRSFIMRNCTAIASGKNKTIAEVIKDLNQRYAQLSPCRLNGRKISRKMVLPIIRRILPCTSEERKIRILTKISARGGSTPKSIDLSKR